MCPSSPWSPGNCFCQWRSKVETADSTAEINHCRDIETKKKDMSYPFGMFTHQSEKISKSHLGLQELAMCDCLCSLTCYCISIEKSVKKV